MSTKLFVGNLPISATEDYLREFFEESGYAVTEVKIMLGRETGRSRGFAFVVFADGTDFQKVIDETNGQSFMGHKLTVNEATPFEPRGEPIQKRPTRTGRTV
jgi:cold-inducible RNA-binding protein